MKTINLAPGSSEWLQARSASKAAAVMGASKWQTRNELLRQMATGITNEVDPATQARFDNGHRTEVLARDIAEDILGEGLSPISGATDDGYLTANYDGLTFTGRIGWEHKDWNEELAAAVRAKELPASHYWQLEQQIIVGSLDYVLFMVSDGTRGKCVSMEYRAIPGRAQALMAGWKQFDEDLKNYQHIEVIPAAVAAPTMQLPALSIQVTGSIALVDNLKVFGERLAQFIEGVPQKPSTDQEFADSEAAIKTLKTAEDALEAAKSSALAQTASIDEMTRTVALYAGQARTTRLMLEKLVKARKETIRVEIVQGGKDALTAHFNFLNKRLGKPYMPALSADFALAAKGKRTIASLRDAVDTELARAKIEANACADRIEINLNCLRELAKDYAFLFADAGQIVHKAEDDFAALVKTRIAEHKDKEVKRFEAEREKIRAEEAAKLAKEQAENTRHLAEESKAREKAAAQVLAQGQAPEPRGIPHSPPASAAPIPVAPASPEPREPLPSPAGAGGAGTHFKPTPKQIICAVATAFDVNEEIAYGWIVEAFSNQRRVT